MSEIVVESEPVETVIEISDGPTLSMILVEDDLVLTSETPDPILIDLNSGPRGEPGPHTHTGAYPPDAYLGVLGDLYVVTQGTTFSGQVYRKTGGNTWTDVGNIRGPAGGINTINGYTGPDVTLVKADVGLGNVDNISDANKPISTATQAALDTTVKLTGVQTIAGAKTFSDFLVSGSSTTVPTIPNGTTGTFSPQITATNTSLAGIAVHTPDGTRNRRAGLYLDDTNNEWGLGFTYSTGSAPFVIKFASTDAMSLTDAGVLTAPSFVGNGANLTALNGTQVTTGTVADARLSTNVATLTGTQTFSGAKTFSDSLNVTKSVAGVTSLTLSNPDITSTSYTVQTYLNLFVGGDNMGGLKATNTLLTGLSTKALYLTTVGAHPIAFGTENSPTPRMVIMPTTGRVGIANQAPTEILDVTGNIKASGSVTGASFSGSGASLTALNGTNISTGTVADARLSTNVSMLSAAETHSGAKTFSALVTAAGVTLSSGAFTGSGSGITALNGTNISTGTVADLRLSSNVALLTGTQTFTGSKTFSLNAAFSAGITIPGTQSAIFDATGVGPPTLTTRSAGTKVVMYSSLTSAVTDYAIGIESANMWYSAGNAAGGHKWYTNTINTMTLNSAGALFATAFIGNGTSLTALDGTNITSGTVADLRLSSNVMLLNGVQTSTGRKVFTSGTGTGIDYLTAPLEIRSDQTGAAPHLSFHWVNVIASQIRVASSGHIQIANNPGNALEGFEAADIYDTGNRVYSASNAPAISAVTGLQAALDTKAPLASPVLTGTPTAPTQATTGNDTQVATSAFVKAVLLAANPVGAILFNVTNINPSTYIGGTWVAWGKGKVPVGIADSGTFAVAAEITLGNESSILALAHIPQHTHTIAHSHTATTAAGEGGVDHVHYNTITDGAGGHGHNYSARLGDRVISNGTGGSITVANASTANYVTDTQGGHNHTINAAWNDRSLNHGHTINVGASDTANSGPYGTASPTGVPIIQPSIAVYMWKRTA